MGKPGDSLKKNRFQTSLSYQTRRKISPYWPELWQRGVLAFWQPCRRCKPFQSGLHSFTILNRTHIPVWGKEGAVREGSKSFYKDLPEPMPPQNSRLTMHRRRMVRVREEKEKNREDKKNERESLAPAFESCMGGKHAKARDAMIHPHFQNYPTKGKGKKEGEHFSSISSWREGPLLEVFAAKLPLFLVR